MPQGGFSRILAGAWHNPQPLSPVPPPRLRLFQKFSTFRILVCGGDGSVGWVLSEIDALGLHKQVSRVPGIPGTGWHCPQWSWELYCMPWDATSGRNSRAGGVVVAVRSCSESPHPIPLPQCQLGVLPLGTGNDLARVLGWGSLCDDDTQLLQILEKLERATTKMLDR